MDEVVLILPPAKHGTAVDSYDMQTLEFLRAFVFDATLTESYQRSATVTEHPVEDGTVITDHVILDPQKVSLTGMVTRTPTSVVRDAEHLEESLEALDGIIDDRQPVSIVNNLKSIADLIVTNLTITRDNTTGQAVNVQLDMTKVDIVEAAVVDIPERLLKAKAKASGTKEKSDGTQSPAETTVEAEAGSQDDDGRWKSWGAGGVDFLSELGG